VRLTLHRPPAHLPGPRRCVWPAGADPNAGCAKQPDDQDRPETAFGVRSISRPSTCPSAWSWPSNLLASSSPPTPARDRRLHGLQEGAHGITGLRHIDPG